MTAYERAQATDFLVRLEKHIESIEKKLCNPRGEEDIQVLRKYWSKLSSLRDRIALKLHEHVREKC
jgi:hypothetical protein